jgi:hypothetical protein
MVRGRKDALSPPGAVLETRSQLVCSHRLAINLRMPPGSAGARLRRIPERVGGEPCPGSCPRPGRGSRRANRLRGRTRRSPSPRVRAAPSGNIRGAQYAAECFTSIKANVKLVEDVRSGRKSLCAGGGKNAPSGRGVPFASSPIELEQRNKERVRLHRVPRSIHARSACARTLALSPCPLPRLSPLRSTWPPFRRLRAG